MKARQFDEAFDAGEDVSGEIDWEKILAHEECRWLHTGGIFAALSETAPQVAEEKPAASQPLNSWFRAGSAWRLQRIAMTITKRPSTASTAC